MLWIIFVLTPLYLCAFACDLSQLSSSLTRATTTCNSTNSSCSSTCLSGFVLQDGNLTTQYSCNGLKWQPDIQLCSQYQIPTLTLTIDIVYVTESKPSVTCIDNFRILSDQNVASLTQSLSNTCLGASLEIGELNITNITSTPLAFQITSVFTLTFSGVGKDSHRTLCIQLIGMVSSNDPSFLNPYSPLSCDGGQSNISKSSTKTNEKSYSCEEGHRVLESVEEIVCAPCLPGSFLNHSECISCPFRTYQPLSGQTHCDACIDGKVVNEERSSCTVGCSVSTLTSNIRDASLNCSSEDVHCVSTCNDGYITRNGTNTLTHTCNGSVWIPESIHCLAYVLPDYRFEIQVEYILNALPASSCMDQFRVLYKQNIATFSGILTSTCRNANLDVGLMRVENITSTDLAFQITSKFSVVFSGQGKTSQRALCIQLIEIISKTNATYLNPFSPITCGSNGESNVTKQSTGIANTHYSCDNGSFSIEGDDQLFCVPCPPGTFMNNSVCSTCPFGTVQSLMAQTSCNSCTDTQRPNEDSTECLDNISTTETTEFVPENITNMMYTNTTYASVTTAQSATDRKTNIVPVSTIQSNTNANELTTVLTSPKQTNATLNELSTVSTTTIQRNSTVNGLSSVVTTLLVTTSTNITGGSVHVSPQNNLTTANIQASNLTTVGQSVGTTVNSATTTEQTTKSLTTTRPKPTTSNLEGATTASSVCTTEPFSNHVQNANLNCTNDNQTCDMTCNSTFLMNDGNYSVRHTCKSGQWTPNIQYCLSFITPDLMVNIEVVYFTQGALASSCVDNFRVITENNLHQFTNTMASTCGGAGLEVGNITLINITTSELSFQITNIFNIKFTGSGITSNRNLCVQLLNIASQNNQTLFNPYSPLTCGNTSTSVRKVSTKTGGQVFSCQSGFQVVKTTAEDTVCVPCSQGSYMNQSECLPCPDGQFQPLSGQTECLVCMGNKSVSDMRTSCIDTYDEITTEYPNSSTLTSITESTTPDYSTAASAYSLITNSSFNPSITVPTTTSTEPHTTTVAINNPAESKLNSDSSGSSDILIVAGVLGVLFVIVTIALIAYIIYSKKKSMRKVTHSDVDILHKSEEGPSTYEPYTEKRDDASSSSYTDRKELVERSTFSNESKGLDIIHQLINIDNSELPYYGTPPTDTLPEGRWRKKGDISHKRKKHKEMAETIEESKDEDDPPLLIFIPD